MNDELVSWQQLPAYTGSSLSTLARLRAVGDFPEPTHRSGNKLLWTRAVVDEWMKRGPQRRVVPLGGNVRTIA